METKQIVFTKPRVAELLTVDCPSPKENEATVRLSASAISRISDRTRRLCLVFGSSLGNIICLDFSFIFISL